jgi:hypothetical protein
MHGGRAALLRGLDATQRIPTGQIRTLPRGKGVKKLSSTAFSSH